MAYRRKLTALFISAAFILTLALSFFFIAQELSHDHGQSGDPCPICEKIDLCLRTLSVCSSVTIPADNGGSVSIPHLFFRRSFPFRRFSSHGFLHAGHPPCQAHRLNPALAFLFLLY